MKRKTIILIAVLVLVVAAIYYFEQSKAGPADLGSGGEEQEMPAAQKKNGLEMPPMPEVQKQGKPPLKDGRWPLAPELVGLTGYINAEEGLQLADLEGKVVLVDFWTYSCINCIRTLPHLTAWDAKYKDKGLVIIGVHTPEFEFEKKRENVLAAMEKYGIQYPVVQDNDYATWRNYKNRFWPHNYLIDADGYIRYDHIGEGEYDKTETVRTTPELYAGYAFALPRGQNIGNEQGLQPGKTVVYAFPLQMDHDTIYLDGTWLSNEDNLEAKSSGVLALDFTAASVNIVADALDKPVMMEVLLDGQYITEDQAGDDVEFDDGKAFVIIDEPRLYNVVDADVMNAELKLKVSQGFTFNAFTFG